MPRIVQNVPVEADIMIPFTSLRDLISHEQKLFAGLGIHGTEKQPQIGELPPIVAGHLVDERMLAVDDFIMRQRQDEVFREGVKPGET